MPKLLEYVEEIEFREYPNGYRALLPSDLDLAVRRLEFATQETELERVETQPEPAEIAKARILAVKTEGPERERLEEKIREFEDRRVAEADGWLAAMWRTQHAIEKMEGQMEAPTGPEAGTPVFVRFQMREFSARERMETDRKFSKVKEREDGTQYKEIEEIFERNMVLLNLCLLGEWVPVAETEKAKAVPGYPVRKFGGEDHRLVKTGPAEDLQQTLADVLIARQWAKNTMNPGLVGFFTKQPPCLRLTSPSPTN